MSWEEHAAALAECFQGKALALPPGPAKPCSLRGPARGPSVQPAGESRHPPSYVSTWALAQRLVATSHGYRSVSAGMLDFPVSLRVAKWIESCKSTAGSKIWLCYLSGVLRSYRLPSILPKKPRRPSYTCVFATLCGLPQPRSTWNTEGAEYKLPGYLSRGNTVS